MIDPYPFSIFYSFLLMVLCTECWYRRDPWLFNHSPLYLFKEPGKPSKAVVPMAPYTRVFSAWHAGGVCLCFFLGVLALEFPNPAKKEVSLALGLLWLIWATTNSWRALYGGQVFNRAGIACHSLIGGCGICAYWHLAYWYTNTTSLRVSEIIVLATFAIFGVVTLANLRRLRAEAQLTSVECGGRFNLRRQRFQYRQFHCFE